MFDANHDVCFLEFVNDVNVNSKSKSTRRRKKKQTWKPTGKVFTDIGYKWKPTRRIFTIVGNSCPLTRFTSTNVEPLKETTLKSVTTTKPEIKINRIKAMGLESVSIRRIQWLGYGVLEFLGVGATFDIFQNLLFPYSLKMAYCLSWIWRIGFVSFVVFGECRHRYAVSSLMDMTYW
ncbi:hypothetical protein Tco_0733836 [Tanacetum coccineum]